MNNAQASLYRRLCGLEITPQAVALSFEARLARENGWDLSQAILVDQEYRKFLFLMLQAQEEIHSSYQICRTQLEKVKTGLLILLTKVLSPLLNNSAKRC